jgi:hypothetical protein
MRVWAEGTFDSGRMRQKKGNVASKAGRRLCRMRDIVFATMGRRETAGFQVAAKLRLWD